MRNIKQLLTCLLILATCLCVLTLVGCDELLGKEEPHEHTLVKHEGQTPTCTEDGWSPYETCSGCNEYTTYKELLPLGHDYTDEYIPNGDVHSRFCERCQKTIDEEHDWEKGDSYSAPTCLDDGLQSYKCATCGARKSETVDSLGHELAEGYKPDGDVHVLTCSRCTYEIEGEHEWQEGEIITAPTCEGDGEQEYVCTVCNGEKTEALTPLGHDYSNTYEPNGDVHSRFCSSCTASTDAQPHDWQAGEIIKEPTCADEGTRLYGCTTCGAEKTESVPETGEHKDGNWKTYPATPTRAAFSVLCCETCEATLIEQELPEDISLMPVMQFTGDYTLATNKKNEIELGVSYSNPNGESFSGYAKIKVQGASSTAYAKKNYNVKLYSDSEYEDKLKYNFGWGKENKYCLKANWVDYTQARNIISCRLWGDIVDMRKTSDIQERLAALKTNGGAIDGFPIVVYMNNEFHGIYTLNVPKDEWMLDMGDGEYEALIGADDWFNTDFSVLMTEFTKNSSGDYVANGTGWELKYCSTEESDEGVKWVSESFNRLIMFCQENSGDAFKKGISQYLDVDAAIDYLIYFHAIYMRDNTSKNILWATYDGDVWFPTVYDQDGSFGVVYDGMRYAPADAALPLVENGIIDLNCKLGSGTFILWDRIWNSFTEEILLRYKELRTSILTEKNIKDAFEEFRSLIPESVYERDCERWAAERETWWQGALKHGEGNIPETYDEFDYEYMYSWISDRLTALDESMRNIYYNAYLPKTDDPAL